MGVWQSNVRMIYLKGTIKPALFHEALNPEYKCQISSYISKPCYKNYEIGDKKHPLYQLILIPGLSTWFLIHIST